MPGKDAIRALREKGQKKAGFKMKSERISRPAPKGDVPRGSGSMASMFIKKEIIPKQFKKRELKKHSYIGLGRTKEGRKPRSPKVPFERGRIGLKPLRKKTRKSSRDSARKSGR